jgi:hypothetical protein
VKIIWLGHSSVLLDLDGVRPLADPLLRDRVGVLRQTEPVPESAALGSAGVEAVLLSHLRDDHCDLRSLRRLGAPLVVVPPWVGRWLTARGVRGVAEVRPGTSMAVGPVLVHAVGPSTTGAAGRGVLPGARWAMWSPARPPPGWPATRRRTRGCRRCRRSPGSRISRSCRSGDGVLATPNTGPAAHRSGGRHSLCADEAHVGPMSKYRF